MNTVMITVEATEDGGISKFIMSEMIDEKTTQNEKDAKVLALMQWLIVRLAWGGFGSPRIVASLQKDDNAPQEPTLASVQTDLKSFWEHVAPVPHNTGAV